VAASVAVAARAVRDAARGLVWWGLGIVGLVATIVAVFPSVKGSAGLNDLVKKYPDALKAFIAFGGTVDYSSGAGYLGSELFSLMIPLLLVVAAVGAGARAIAGEEEAGTLELLLATPLSRLRLVAGKAIAIALELAALGVVLWAALAVATAIAGMDVGAGRLAAATLAAVLLAVLYGMLALLAGAATGRRAIATAIAGAAAVAAYLLNALALFVGPLEPLRAASPFYHYVAGDPLRHGFSPVHSGILAATALVLALAAAPALQRRDLR
jgi:beta-exotoxin I transport system permease protein